MIEIVLQTLIAHSSTGEYMMRMMYDWISGLSLTIPRHQSPQYPYDAHILPVNYDKITYHISCHHYLDCINTWKLIQPRLQNP